MGHFLVVAMGHLVVHFVVDCCKEWLVELLVDTLVVAGSVVVVPADSCDVRQPSMDFLVQMLVLIVVLRCLLLLVVDASVLLVVLELVLEVMTCRLVYV